MTDADINAMLDQMEKEFNTAGTTVVKVDVRELQQHLRVLLDNYTTLNNQQIDEILARVFLELRKQDLSGRLPDES